MAHELTERVLMVPCAIGGASTGEDDDASEPTASVHVPAVWTRSSSTARPHTIALTPRTPAAIEPYSPSVILEARSAERPTTCGTSFLQTPAVAGAAKRWSDGRGVRLEVGFPWSASRPTSGL